MTRKSKSFTLVEILLALGVIMIGVVSIMGLFPVASKATSDAAMETYTANAIEEFAAYIADTATRDVGSATGNAGWQNVIVNDNLLPDSEPSAMLGTAHDEESNAEEVLDADKWETISRNNSGNDGLNKFLFKHKTEKGVFLLVSVRGKSQNDTFNLGNDDDQELIDSRVLITAWKSPIKRIFRQGASEETDSAYGYGARISIKAGWPAERPEAKRTEYDDGKYDWIPLRQIKVSTFDLHKPITRN